MAIIIDVGAAPIVLPPEFRDAFPEFSNATTYPDATINFWLLLGMKLMNPCRWGDLAPYGLMLFVAHNLALGQMSIASSSQGIPGLIVGSLTAASVDKVSYSRAQVLMDPKNGQWNLTTYGMRWIALVKMVGAGPIQVGVPPGGSNYGWAGAWPGVVFPPANQ